MMDALITLAGLISLFAWFVLVGVAFFKFERYRTNTKLLRCPETEGVTLVELDTRASSAANPRLFFDRAKTSRQRLPALARETGLRAKMPRREC